MNSLRRILGIGVLAFLLSGCWPTPGAGPDRRSYNPAEQTLRLDVIDDLQQQFRVPLAEGAGPPVVTGNGLFVRSGLAIRAFEPGTGAARWTAPLTDGAGPEFAASDPYIRDENTQVYATVTRTFSGQQASEVVSLDTATGAAERREGFGRIDSLRGERTAEIWNGVIPPAQSIGGLRVSNLAGDELWGGYAFPARRGTVTLGPRQLFVGVDTGVLAYDTTTPCVDNGGLFSPSCPVQWNRPLPGPATPVVIGENNTLYVGAGTSVYALDAATGNVLWSTDIGAPVTQPPSLARNLLFVPSSDGRLSTFVVDNCTGTCPVMWTSEPGSAVSAQPASVIGNVVFAGYADGTVRAFNTSACYGGVCEPLWSADAGGTVTGLAVFNRMLYVGTADGLVGYGLPPD